MQLAQDDVISALHLTHLHDILFCAVLPCCPSLCIHPLRFPSALLPKVVVSFQHPFGPWRRRYMVGLVSVITALLCADQNLLAPNVRMRVKAMETKKCLCVQTVPYSPPPPSLSVCMCVVISACKHAACCLAVCMTALLAVCMTALLAAKTTVSSQQQLVVLGCKQGNSFAGLAGQPDWL